MLAVGFAAPPKRVRFMGRQEVKTYDANKLSIANYEEIIPTIEKCTYDDFLVEDGTSEEDMGIIYDALEAAGLLDECGAAGNEQSANDVKRRRAGQGRPRFGASNRRNNPRQFRRQ